MEIRSLRVAQRNEQDWIDVYLLGDFHEGNSNFSEERLKEAVQIIKKNTEVNKKTFVILMGDHCEYITTQRDPRWDPVAIDSKYKIRDLKNLAKKQNEYLFYQLEPIADYVVAALIGNHGESCVKHNQIDVYDDFCKRFPLVEKLGYVGYFIFKVDVGRGKEPRGRVTFALNHGEGGGGKTLGYAVNKVYDLFRFEDSADYRVCGHLHRLIARSVVLRSPNKYCNGLNRRRVWFACSGCFLETYQVGNKNYYEHKGREESDIGMLKASFRFKRYGTRGKDLRWVKQTLLKKIRFYPETGWEEEEENGI